MKVSHLLLLAIVVVSAVAATAERTSKASFSRIQNKKAANRHLLQPQDLYCDVCIQFAVAGINQLLNYILNVGIPSTCQQLCSSLNGTGWEDTCQVICFGAGLYEFIKWLETSDLDPIYYCQLATLCKVKDCTLNVCANISSIFVNPPAGPLGTSFDVYADFNVFAETGAGSIGLTIQSTENPNDRESSRFLVSDGFMPPNFGLKIGIGSEELSPGSYDVTVRLCQGGCGNRSPHSRELASAETTFTVT